MKRLIKLTILSILTSLFLTSHAVVQAEEISITNSDYIAGEYNPAIIPRPSNLPGPDSDKFGGKNASAEEKGARKVLLNSVLPKFAVATVGLVGILSMVFLVIGGVRYVTYYGNDESVDKAKKQVIYSIVGLFVALFSYTIVRIVTNIQFEEIQTDKIQSDESATTTTPNTTSESNP